MTQQSLLRSYCVNVERYKYKNVHLHTVTKESQIHKHSKDLTKNERLIIYCYYDGMLWK